MGRGRAYRRHQELKRKRRKEKFFRAVWPRTAINDDAVRDGKTEHFITRWRKEEVVINDTFVGVAAKSNGIPYAPFCRCDYCMVRHERQLRKHIDSHGDFGYRARLIGDKYHGY